MRNAVIAAIVVLAASTAMGGTPAQAIADGRARIAARDCHGAVQVMQDAIPDAVALVDSSESASALSAIHFYSALAFHECGLSDQTKFEIREFFRFRPGASQLDPAKYPRAFVALFDEVQAQVKQTAPAKTAFESFYGDVNAFAIPARRQRSIALWGSLPEFLILGTDEEREEWGRLRDDESRVSFIAAFWQRRDPDPQTAANEYREEVVRRVVLADRAFRTAADEEGSLSDRGRVYVLLGPPARVHRQPIQRFETTFVIAPRTRTTPLAGTLERWVYFRPQLPGVAAQQVEFRFITQPGYGEYVMQRDFWPLKAMAEARRTRENEGSE